MMSRDGGEEILLDDLNVVTDPQDEQQQQQPRRPRSDGVDDASREQQPSSPRYLKSHPTPIPYATLSPASEEGWSCSHEDAQRSLYEMDMRISRSREWRTSLQSRFQSDLTSSTFAPSTGPPFSVTTPDEDHPQQWQRQQQQDPQPPADVAYGGSTYGVFRGSIYSGSPPSEYRNRSYRQSNTVGLVPLPGMSPFVSGNQLHRQRSAGAPQHQEWQHRRGNDDNDDVEGGRSGHNNIPIYLAKQQLLHRHQKESRDNGYASADAEEGGKGGGVRGDCSDDGSDRPAIEDDDVVAGAIFDMDLS